MGSDNRNEFGPELNLSKTAPDTKLNNEELLYYETGERGLEQPLIDPIDILAVSIVAKVQGIKVVITPKHPPHHKFGWPFNKKMAHWQIILFKTGKSGTDLILRIPIK